MSEHTGHAPPAANTAAGEALTLWAGWSSLLERGQESPWDVVAWYPGDDALVVGRRDRDALRARYRRAGRVLVLVLA